jgi:tRNA(Ile)-lysidine synthetase-like protein
MIDAVTGVLVAVSGGPDSVVLLDILIRLAAGVRGWGSGVGDEQQPSLVRGGRANPQPPTPLPHLHVAHLNHMLRGRESAADAEFVRAVADRLGLEITIGSVDVRAAAEAAGRGLEETAREIRYDFLLSVANETGCDRIAVGHTMTDQAETFLMRLIRGSGSRGLAAMRPVSATPLPREKAEGGRQEAEGGRQKAEGGRQKAEGGRQEAEGGRQEAEGGRQKAESGRQKGDEGANSLLPSAFCLLPSPLLIRPLLCITREEVEAYCREGKLEFRTDETNRDLHYTRNRIRGELLPLMTSLNPQVVESIARAAENLAGDQDALDFLTSSLLENARVQCRSEKTNSNDGATAYSVTALLEQPAGLRRRMIIEALRLARCADGIGPPAGEVSSTHIRAVASLLKPKAGGKRITLPGGLEVWREFDVLMVTRFGVESPSYEIGINGTEPVNAGKFAFTLERGLPGTSLPSVIETTRHERARVGLDWMAVALADCALPESLVIRPRQPGECAHVVGQRKTKKLKKLMIDHRIPSSRRANWPLVTTTDGRYVWSPGLPPALEYAAGDESKRLAILRATPI